MTTDLLAPCTLLLVTACAGHRVPEGAPPTLPDDIPVDWHDVPQPVGVEVVTLWADRDAPTEAHLFVDRHVVFRVSSLNFDKGVLALREPEPGQSWRVPDGVHLAVAANDMTDATIAWANTHEVYVAVSCALPTPVGLHYVWCTQAGPPRTDLLATRRELVGLDLSGNRLTDHGAAELRWLDHLGHLELTGTEVGDDGLRALRRLPRLRHLGLAHTEVTAAGLVDLLAERRDLESLSLAEIELRPEDLQVLAGLTRLRALDLSDTGLDGGLGALTVLPDLYALDLSHNAIGDDDVANLVQLPVRRLDLGWTQLTDASMQPLATMSRLTWLNLETTRVGHAGVQALGALRGLRLLDLGGNEVYTASVAWLRDLQHLEVLGLRFSQVTLEGTELPEALAPFQRLRALNLDANRVPEDGGVRLLEGLANLPELDSLSLLGTVRLDESTGAALAGLRALRFLDLTEVEGTAEGATQLGTLPELRGLVLYGSAMPLGPLGALRELRALDILHTKSPDGRALLCHQEHLRALWASGSAIPPEDIVACVQTRPKLNFLLLGAPFDEETTPDPAESPYIRTLLHIGDAVGGYSTVGTVTRHGTVAP